MKRVMPEMGCVIDGSHMSNFDFMVAVIRYAADRGFELEQDAMENDVVWMNTPGEDDPDRLSEILDALDWTYEDALEYLNSITPADYFYLVEDQSLFLEMTND